MPRVGRHMIHAQVQHIFAVWVDVMRRKLGWGGRASRVFM